MHEAVVDILAVNRKAASLLDIAGLIEKGLSSKAIDRLKTALKLTDREVSSTLGVSPKTISRLRSQPKRKLGVGAGDRLYRAAHLFSLARTVFGDQDLAREWLRTTQIGLGHRIPLDVIATEAGAREVEDLLGRIEHGVLW